MRIGLVTDSLGDLGLEEMLRTAAGLGIGMVEFGCGNWSRAPHLDLDALLDSAAARRDFLARIASHGLEISALNCSGNPLHPGEPGRRHWEVTRKTIRLAGLLGVGRVVLMSGCPGGPGDANPNWVTTSWPPETARVLAWQWDEVLIPAWRNLEAAAREAGGIRLCLELHGQQTVYNVATLLRLRDAAGALIGANFDPSHLMWMGADPLAAIPALDDAIFHVHAKDTRIDAANAGVNSVLDTTPMEQETRRAWRYVTLGQGHDAAWWGRFCTALRAASYDDVLSIEHEDTALPPLEGVRRSVEVLRKAMPGG